MVLVSALVLIYYVMLALMKDAVKQVLLNIYFLYADSTFILGLNVSIYTTGQKFIDV